MDKKAEKNRLFIFFEQRSGEIDKIGSFNSWSVAQKILLYSVQPSTDVLEAQFRASRKFLFQFSENKPLNNQVGNWNRFRRRLMFSVLFIGTP